jgi:membrane fusion protein (multidrug efflux system)
MTTRRRTLAWAAVAAILIAGALVPRLLSSRSGPSPGREMSSSDAAVPVRTVTVRPQTLTERLSTTGTVRANEDVELVAEISGKVSGINFREGSRVAKGQLLLEIDDEQLRAERDRAAYRLNLAERSEARQRRLLDEGLTSQEEYDFALSELNVLRAELELAEARLVKTRIHAPFEGVIGLRDVSIGSYLTPQTRIATLQDVDPVKIDFSVPEKYVRHLREGATIQFRTKGSERAHTGTIFAIEPLVDLDTRSLTVRARSPNPDGELVPGAFADVEIVVRRIEGALAVPSRAVIPELEGKKVFVYESGEAQPRPVETGLRTAELVEVTRGLEANDRVIVTAIQRMRPGLPVALEEDGQ